jgi:hypothetical protein
MPDKQNSAHGAAKNKKALMKKTKQVLVDEVLQLQEELKAATASESVTAYKRSWLFCCWKRVVYDEEPEEGSNDSYGSFLRTKFCRWMIVVAIVAAVALIFSSTSYDHCEDPSLYPWNRLSVQSPSVEVPQGMQDTVSKIKRHFTEDKIGPGKALYELGLRHHYPVLLIPGIVSTGLEVRV